MKNRTAEVLQKVVAPWVSRGILEQGYYHLGGAVARAVDVAELTTPKAVLDAWRLRYEGSPFPADPDYVDVLRFSMHPLMSLTAPADIERPWPTFANGFLGGEALAPVWMLERTRVPAGAELWRLQRDGEQRHLATYVSPGQGWSGGRGYYPPVHLVGTRAKWLDLDVPADIVGDGTEVELVVVGETAPDGFQQVRVGVWCRTVPRTEVAELFELTLTCRYRSVPCRIIQRTSDQTRLLLLDDDPDTVRQLNAEEADIGSFEITASTAELTDIAGVTRESVSA